MRGYSYEFIKKLRALAKRSNAPKCARLGLLAVERGVAITTIASRVGVSRMAVYDWFTGKYEPTEGNLRKLEKCINGN